jgi:flagellar biogenesis protein FliO
MDAISLSYIIQVLVSLGIVLLLVLVVFNVLKRLRARGGTFQALSLLKNPEPPFQIESIKTIDLHTKIVLLRFENTKYLLAVGSHAVTVITSSAQSNESEKNKKNREQVL